MFVLTFKRARLEALARAMAIADAARAEGRPMTEAERKAFTAHIHDVPGPRLTVLGAEAEL